MPLPSGLSTDLINNTGFVDGLTSADALNGVNGWDWNNNTPATYDPTTGSGFKWAGGTAGTAGGTISYRFDTGSNWTAAEQTVFRDSLALWSGLANISFTETTSNAAPLVFYRNPSSSGPSGQAGGAYAVPSGFAAGTVGSTTMPAVTAAYVSLETGAQGAYFNFNDTFTNLFNGQAGGSGVATVIHEIGHTLGLAHPGPYNGNVVPSTQQFSAVDTWMYSTMSYIAPETTTAKYYSQYAVTGTFWGTSGGFGREPTTAQIMDILAIQQLYGASTNATFSGGKTYGFNCTLQAQVAPFYDFSINTKPIITIWNSGTGNTLDLSGYNTTCTVNLNAGTFSSFAGLTNNVAIAYGTRMDTAIGGSADDIFFENANGDVIDGKAGANTVVLRLNQVDYTMTKTPSNVITVTTKIGNVSDTLTNIGTLRFADGSTLAASAIACFARGTRIAVPGGAIPVERLLIGGLVQTASGQARRIRWIGRRAYAGAFLAANAGAQPIRVREGAIEDGVPQRDLFVSPRHALFLDGVLIPAEALVNGVSVTRCTDWTEVEYTHIELEGHDILLAEGCPAESFVDDDSRGLFQNADEFAALYPEDRSLRGAFCAALVEHGEVLAAVRRRIDARAGVSVAPAVGPVHGFVDVVTHDCVIGWARIAGSAGPLRLEVVADGHVVGRVVANRLRPDVLAAGFGDGRCGFELHGLKLDAGMSHDIRVQRVGDGAVLGQQVLAAGPTGSAIEAAQATLSGVGGLDGVGADLDRLIGFFDGQAERLRGVRAAAARAPRAGVAGVKASVSRPRALVIDDQPPAPDRDAASSVLLSHMRALQRQGWDVSFVASQPLAAGRDDAALGGSGVTVLSGHGSVEALLRRHAGVFELVYLHRLGNAAQYGTMVRVHCPRARVIYSVADLNHLRIGRQAAVEMRPELSALAERVRMQELLAAAQADAVITHSSHEAALLRAALPQAEVRMVPWAVAAAPVAAPFGARHGVGFLGGFGHLPNVDGAIWLVREVMPLVWRTHPGIVLRLAGDAMPASVSALAGPGVEVLGRVRHVADLFGSVRLTVGALRFGAGVKGMVLDSMAAGVPVAMTPVAAEGAGFGPVLLEGVGADATALAAVIVAMHEDEALNGRLAAAGLAHVGACNSEAAVDAGLRMATGRLPRLRAA